MRHKITRKELIKRYIEFFIHHKSFPHKEIPNAPLVPENDPTVLFTTAGMQPLVPYFLGEAHPSGKRLTNIQKCIRTVDIEEVGNSYHHTFFEMLGKWSIGDYWKEDAINLTYGFLTKSLKIPKERLAATCFKGDKISKKDEESARDWESLGIPSERIAFLGEDNWWGPAGETGPCGPCTEIFYWKPNNTPTPKEFDPEDKRWVEIGNDVLMAYNKDKKGNYNLAKRKIIDFGGGVERILAILNNQEDNYLTDVWQPIIRKIETLSGKKYEESEETKKAMRIIADHIKASVMILADGIKPGNSEQGYVLRRLIRRAIRYLREMGIEEQIMEISKVIFDMYDDYEHLQNNKDKIIEELSEEHKKFLKTLDKGIKEFYKIIESLQDKTIKGKDSFLLYQSYGFPIEITKELAQEKGLKVDENEFEKKFRKHQELSKTASAGKFKSGLADDSKQTKKLHTATHLLNQALREVLNDGKIYQKGSNINPERLRFDFNFERKLTGEEKQSIEKWINDKIQKELPVQMEEMSLDKAKKQGAQGVFDEKYGGKVNVYTIKDKKGNIISNEICAGPHVENTKELGHFRIKKEQSSSSGVRRIKAILE